MAQGHTLTDDHQGQQRFPITCMSLSTENQTQDMHTAQDYERVFFIFVWIGSAAGISFFY